MSEFPHDSFAKNYLTELLSAIGTAIPNKFIKSERREGDVWFERDRKLSIPAQRKKLGLMGQLLAWDSLIEALPMVDYADGFQDNSAGDWVPSIAHSWGLSFAKA